MIDQPSSPPLISPVDNAGKITLTDLRWPFSELNAQGVPAELPVADPSVQLTLSVLAAQKNGVPTLVQYDDAGRVLATGDRVQGTKIDAPPAQLTVGVQVLTTGTESLRLYVRAPNAPAVLTTIQVNGLDSGIVYYPLTAMQTINTQLVVQVDTAQDSRVEIRVNNGNAVQTDTVLVTLVKAVDELTVLSNPGQEPLVLLQGQYLTPVEVIQSQPFNVSLAPGASLVLAVGAANKVTRAHELGIAFIGPTGADIALEDDNGVRAAYVNGGVVRYEAHRLYGVPFTTGHDVRLKNVAGAATPVVSGHLSFSQA